MKVSFHVHVERLIFWVVLGLIGLFILVSPSQARNSLTLDEYLNQVRLGNQALEGSEKISQGAQLRSDIGTLHLSPMLFGRFQYLDDKRPTNNPLFMGSQTKLKNYNLGVKKLTSFGLEGKLYYELNQTEIIGASPAFLPFLKWNDARPVLELSQSLWRNFFGAETRASQELIQTQILANAYKESFQVKQRLAEAEIAYWGLALARETVSVNKESLERAQKIKDWAARRAKLQLSDQSDLLQAEAALQARGLEFQSALDDAREASRNFNSLRGLDSDLVDEMTYSYSDPLADFERVSRLGESFERQGGDISGPPGVREDVLALEQQTKLLQAQAEIEKQKLAPELQLFGMYSLNARRADSSDAISDSFKSDRPMWSLGVSFSASLDVPTILASRRGLNQEIEGLQLQLDRKRFEQKQEWKELTRKFHEITKKLELSVAIEKAQKQKLVFEKDRFNRGRTTTYQVLLFEQDFANAQLGRIRLQAELMKIKARLKTFFKTRGLT